MKKELTCIICPIGCHLIAEFENETVLSVAGNSCIRGKAYAEKECIAPVRTITTTVRTGSGELVPVKTEKPIAKEKIKEAMQIINKSEPHLPIFLGVVIIKDVFGSAVVATKTVGGSYGEK